MSRPIKFRAVINNKVYEVVSIQWSVDYRANLEKFKYVTVMGDGHETYDDTQAILIQNTGLHDKNGVELFESDIVRYLGWLWEIKWGENTTAFYLCSIEKDIRPDAYFGSAVSPDCERIGNVYERPS